MSAKKSIVLDQSKGKNSPQRSGRNQNDLYRNILASLNVIVFIFDMNDFRLVWVNSGFRKILGYNKPQGNIPEEVMLEIYHPDDRDLLMEMKKFFENDRKGTFTGIYQFKNINGDYVWLCTACNLYKKSRDGKVFQVVGVSMDFTDEIAYDRNLKIITREKTKESNSEAIAVLSKREQELIKYFANGYKTKEVAEFVGLSFHTVNNHRKNMIKKLGLKNLAGLVNWAVENGLS